MRNWIKLLFVLALVLVANDVFGQGCSQCKQAPQSTADAVSIGKVQNSNVLFQWILFYVGIPVAVICITLTIVFRKKVGKGFRKVFGK